VGGSELPPTWNGEPRRDHPTKGLSSTRLKLLYIAGAGRSGSTLLDGVLGQLDGFFAAGELRYLWERGLQESRLCGCGVAVRDCPTWRAVLASAFGPGVDANAAARLQRKATRVRCAPAMILSGRLGRRRSGRLGAVLGPLYQAIQESTGCRVLVDSSKLPSYGALLEALPGVELYVLHLVRDPRATAWSWLRRKRLTDTPAPRLMQRQPPGKSAAMWMVWNLTTALLWSGGPRYLRLRYEDLVRRPEAAVRRIAELVGESPAALPFPVPGRVALAPTHSVAGNPGRLDTGEVALRLDDEWSSRLRPRHKLLVTLATWPLLLHYRYRVARRGGTIRWD
jgi:Sulfotransferase family